MRDRDAKEKKEWDAFMAEEAGQFQQDVALAKSFDQDWQPRPDGELKERWEKRQ